MEIDERAWEAAEDALEQYFKVRLPEEIGFEGCTQIVLEAYEKAKASTAEQPDESPLSYEDSELEMAYIDGYHGKTFQDYASSGDPKHIAGLRAIAKMVIWGAANKINGELCDENARLKIQLEAELKWRRDNDND